METHLLTLGRLSVVSNGEELAALTSRPVRAALLVHLAIERETTRDTVAALLWPERQQSRARHALRQTLYELRRDLGDEWLVSDAELLRATAALRADAVDFEAAVKAEDYERALVLYGGAFLEGHHLTSTTTFQGWIDQVRARLSRLHRRARRERIDLLVATNDPLGALDVARGWTDIDPYEDEAQHRLIELLAATGKAREALRQYEAYARVLATEDLEPLDITKDLRTRIREDGLVEVRGVGRGAAEAKPIVSEAAQSREPAGPPAPTEIGPGARPDFDSPRPRGPAHRMGWRRAIPGVAVGMGALAVATVALMLSAGRDDGGSDLRPERVIVMPFENQTGDPSLDVVGPMAADRVSQGLSRIGRLEVTPSMMMLTMLRQLSIETGADGEPSSLAVPVAERNGAGTLITGRFYQREGRLEFFAQVTDVGRGELWQALDPARAPSDRPEVALEAISQRLMGALAARFDPDALLPSPSLMHPPRYDAYRAYLTGIDRYLREGYAAGLPHWRRAARLDTAFVRARLLVAAALFNMGALAEGDSLVASVAEQRDRLAPGEHANLAYLEAWVRGDWNGKLRSARAGSRVLPGFTVDYVYAADLLAVGRPREALERFENLDPQPEWSQAWTSGWETLTGALHLVGQHHRELDRAREARTLHPSQLATVYLELRALVGLGRTAEAMRGFAKAEQMTSGWGWTPGVVARLFAAELLAHGAPESSRQAAARAIAWYEARPTGERETGSYRVDLARSLMLADRLAEADSLLHLLRADFPDEVDHLGLQGIVAARIGDAGRADSIAADLAAIRRPYVFGAPRYWCAAIAAHLGRERGAIGLLRQAFAEGHGVGIRIHGDPNLAPLWELPTFETLVSGAP